jgi:chorismate-pyruvate lyase
MEAEAIGEAWPGADDRLARLHFTMQHSADARLARVAIGALDPLLRSLLFTDGTVTRALEAQTLARVAVEVLEQTQASLPSHAARYLDAEPDADCLRRRVAMSTSRSRPAVWAESHILLERLPDDFLELLNRGSQGIGGSIERSHLESRRELLWFGLGAAPSWAAPGTSPGSALVRLYRIFTDDRPALLICEAFAVERRLGVYRARRLNHAVPSSR